MTDAKAKEDYFVTYNVKIGKTQFFINFAKSTILVKCRCALAPVFACCLWLLSRTTAKCDRGCRSSLALLPAADAPQNTVTQVYLGSV